jgi:hypothetical protein
MPPLDKNRIADLGLLMEMMPRLITPAVAPIAAPDAALLKDPAGLAHAAAASSEAIVHAVAALGSGGDDAAQAQILWTQTLAQIERIQKLHHLPPLPFQAAAKLAQLPAELNPPEPPLLASSAKTAVATVS